MRRFLPSLFAALSLIATPAFAASVTVDIDQEDVFPNTWITANAWPPTVDVSSTNVSRPPCPEPEGPMVERERDSVLGWEACVETGEEGAAGSSYHTATYELVKDGTFVTIEWTLRETRCANYDEPYRSQCEDGQDAFWDGYEPEDVVAAVLDELNLEEETELRPGAIRNAEFEAGYDTLHVELPWSLPDAFVQVEYTLQDTGAAFGSFRRLTYGETDVSIEDFRGYVVRPGGTGKGIVELSYCQELDDSTYTVVCGPVYTINVDAGADTDFSDVSGNHPNADAIRYVLQQGIASGYPNGTFMPDATTNRAEFTKLVTLYTFGQKMVDMCNTHVRFFDVPLGAWYRPYICRAQDSHLVGGYPDGSFKPADTINFAEAAKILVLADDFNTGDVGLTESNPWYERYVRYLAERNAIPTSVYSLSQPITRGQTVEIIYRLKTGNTSKQSRTYEELAA